MAGVLNLKPWVPLTQKWREFTPEIVDSLKWFADKNGLVLFDVLQEVVSKIMWHDKAYLREFDIWTTKKDINFILMDCDGVEVFLDSENGELSVRKFYEAGHYWNIYV